MLYNFYYYSLSFVYCITLAFLLFGCTPSTTPILTVAKNLLPTNSAVYLSPNYKFLRTSFISNDPLPRPVIYLALGSTHETACGIVQNWYSADKNIIKFCNDRLCGTEGLPLDWREVLLKQVPSWEQARLRNYWYVRQRFVMPGYHFGIYDRILLRKRPPPTHSLLVAYNPNQFSWFEELTFSSEKDMNVPPARYAVDYSAQKPQVIYSEQCLMKGLCFAFQAWSAKQELEFRAIKKHYN